MKIPTTGRQYPKLVKEVAIPFNYTANGVNAKASTKKGVLTTTIPLPAEQESSSSGVEALRATRTLPPRPTKLRRVKLHPARALFLYASNQRQVLQVRDPLLWCMCQKKDWRTHKKICTILSCVRVETRPNKGKVLVARKSFRVGDVRCGLR
jgi:hypothetical protein